MEKPIIAVPYLAGMEALPIADVGRYMELRCAKHLVSCVNWPQVCAYQPLAAFAVARSRQSLLFHFMVRGEDLRAVNTAPLSPVADDSCVEVFLQVPGSDEYWNFEFNCIGTVNASHRVTRPNPSRLTPEQISSIAIAGSCGDEPFDEIAGVHTWTLTVRLPFALLGIGQNELPDHLLGNIYKCAGKTHHRHYLSWAPIHSDAPDFHRPEDFGILSLY